MKQETVLRHTIHELVEDLRTNLREIGLDSMPQAEVVNNTRDRLRYIASLTEQAASQTLNVAEMLKDQLQEQTQRAQALARRTRSPALRDFLADLETENTQARHALSEVIQAQAFQDLVGQVVNKLLVTVEKMETGLAHLLIEEEPDPGLLAGPQVRAEEQVSQEDIDNLFD